MFQLYIKKKTKKQRGGIFFSMEYHLYWQLKSSCFEYFGDEKYRILSQIVDKNRTFIDYSEVLVLIVSWMKNMVFFEPKYWWKDDIYWLLKRSCFELFGDGKYGPFWVEKLLERWYLHGLFVFYMIFQDLGNIVFSAVIYTYLTLKCLVLQHKLKVS